MSNVVVYVVYSNRGNKIGLEYEYGLRFRYEDLYGILEDLAQNATVVEGREIDVILPEWRITLPFTSHFKSEPIYLDESTKTLSFDISLYFKPDDEIELYIKEQEEYLGASDGDFVNYRCPRDDQGRVAIGYIYLYISFSFENNMKFANLAFASATTRMGILFTNSPSIRQTFIDFLISHNGLFAYITDSDCLSFDYIYPVDCDVNKARALLR